MAAALSDSSGSGSRLVKYEFKKSRGKRIKLGHGNFGKVYLAIDNRSGADIAIKEITISYDTGKLTEEVKILTQLPAHKNIVRYIGCEGTKKCLRILMELVSGGTLTKRIKEKGPLLEKEPELRHWAAQLMEGLAFLHRLNVVHRDIKDSNLLIDENQQILKITDFGLSRELANMHEPCPPNYAIGTFEYMAPEVVQRKQQCTAKGDIWSAGATLIKAATGNSPFHSLKFEAGDEFVYLRENFERIPTIPTSLSEHAQDFLQRCLTVDPADRPVARELLKHPFLDRNTVASTGCFTLLPESNPTTSNRGVQTIPESPQDPSSAPSNPVTSPSPVDSPQQHQTPTANDQKEEDEAGYQFLRDVMRKEAMYCSPKNTRNSSAFVPLSSMTPHKKTSLTTKIQVHQNLICQEVGPLAGVELSTQPVPKEIIQVIIPKLYERRDLPGLIQLGCNNADRSVKLEAFKTACHVLTFIQVRDQQLMRLLPVAELQLTESVLNPCFLHLSLDVLEELFHCYSRVIVQIYLGTLLGTVNHSITKDTCRKVIDVLRRVHSGGGSKCQGSPHKRVLFETIQRFLKKFLERFSEKLPTQTFLYNRNLLNRTIDLCEENYNIENAEKAKKRLISDISESRSSMEKNCLLQYIALQAQLNFNLFSIVKILVKKLRKITKIGEQQWFVVSVCSIYERGLLHTNHEDECKTILEAANGDEGFGLLEFLKSYKKKPNLMSVAKHRCLNLLYHNCRLVRSSMAQILVNENNLSKDDKSLITFHLRKTLEEHFRVVQIRLQTQNGLGGENKPKLDYTSRSVLWNGAIESGKITIIANILNPYIFNTDNQSKEKPKGEVESLLALSPHTHIVSLLAFQNEIHPSFYLAEVPKKFELFGQHLLRQRDLSPPLSLHDVIKLYLLPVTRAVLHCQGRGVYLRNLTGSSFWVGQQQDGVQVKLHDFSMAVLSQDIVFHGKKQDPIPLLWSAPESILACCYSLASDTYMLGHVILEAATMGCFPFNELYGLDAIAKAEEVLTHGIRPEAPACLPQALSTYILRCFPYIPKNRIRVSRILEILEYFLSVSEIEKDEYIPPVRDSSQPSEPYRGIPESLRNLTTLEELWKEEEQQKREERRKSRGRRPLSTLESMDVWCDPAELHEADDPEVERIQEHPLGYSIRVPLDGEPEGAHRAILESLQHENLVQFLGIRHEGSRVFLRMLTPSEETLLDYALSLSPTKDQLPRLISIFHQIALGMEYLHMMNLVHTHLQARFVYVSLTGPSCEPRVCVGHLGRSRLLVPGPYTERMKDVSVILNEIGTPGYNRPTSRWLARETNSYGKFTMQSDVMAFGLLIAEVLRAWQSVPGTPANHVAPYFDIPLNQVVHQQAKRISLPRTPGCPEWLYDLIKTCMLDPSHRRPMFSEISRCLGSRNPQYDTLIRDRRCSFHLEDYENEDDPYVTDDACFGFYLPRGEVTPRRAVSYPTYIGNRAIRMNPGRVTWPTGLNDIPEEYIDCPDLRSENVIENFCLENQGASASLTCDGAVASHTCETDYMAAPPTCSQAAPHVNSNPTSPTNGYSEIDYGAIALACSPPAPYVNSNPTSHIYGLSGTDHGVTALVCSSPAPYVNSDITSHIHSLSGTDHGASALACSPPTPYITPNPTSHIHGLSGTDHGASALACSPPVPYINSNPTSHIRGLSGTNQGASAVGCLPPARYVNSNSPSHTHGLSGTDQGAPAVAYSLPARYVNSSPTSHTHGLSGTDQGTSAMACSLPARYVNSSPTSHTHGLSGTDQGASAVACSPPAVLSNTNHMSLETGLLTTSQMNQCPHVEKDETSSSSRTNHHDIDQTYIHHFSDETYDDCDVEPQGSQG